MKKYYDYDDIKYKGIKDVRSLFDMSVDEGYYKPIRTSSSNYIEYESMEDKEKILKIKEYLDMIKLYHI